MKGSNKAIAFSVAAILAMSMLAMGAMAGKPQPPPAYVEPYGKLVMTSSPQLLLKVTGYVRIYDWVNGKFNHTWSGNSDDNVHSVGAIGDVDNDGTKDVVTIATVKSGKGAKITYTHTLKIWHNGDTSNSPSVSVNFANRPEFIAIGDVDRDGKNELVVVLMNTDIEIWDCTSSGCTKQTTISDVGEGPLTLADSDNDGYSEILVAGATNDAVYYGHGLIIDYANGIYSIVADLGPKDIKCTIGDISVGDLDGVAGNEIFGSGYCDGSIYIWQYSNGTYNQIWTTKLSKYIHSNNEIADINGDGKNEIAFTEFGTTSPITENLIVYKYDGSNNWSELGKYSGCHGNQIGMMVSADLDSDGNDELVIQDQVWKWNGSAMQMIQDLTDDTLNDVSLA